VGKRRRFCDNAAMVRLACAALALSLTGCFSVSEPDCAYKCGAGGACPEHYQCRDDNYCHKTGSTSQCPYPTIDMSASVDGGGDLAVGDLASPDLSVGDLASPDLAAVAMASADLSLPDLSRD
jgi:hypothetical protein